MMGPKKDVVYLKLPYKGSASEKFAKNINSAVKSTYYSVNVRVVFSTECMLHSSLKDKLPYKNKSGIIYKFTCNRCESEYIGKSSRRLSLDFVSQVKQEIVIKFFVTTFSKISIDLFWGIPL